MNENAIRDLLARDLSIVEEGLELIEIEKYIPPSLGTRCFLDILAKDRNGHWVIIEVKKTKAASREAAHEVFKYVEAVQHHFGARNDEIRAIVAAIDWAEMLVPFSKLTKETIISVQGVRLELSEKNTKLQAIPVEPVAVSQGRYLAPWHELNLYHDKSSLEIGIQSYHECCKVKGINDYVMVVLKAANNFHECASLALDAVEVGLGADFPRLNYILYFSPQILTKEFCFSVIERKPELLDEVIGYTAGMDENEELCILHSNVYNIEPRPFRDYYEIGYAAKFAGKLLVNEGWTIERVVRSGTFDRNVLLSDEAIVDELKGLSAGSGRAYRRSINLSNQTHISSAREALAAALDGNPAWKVQMNFVLDEISESAFNGVSDVADIQLYNPTSGIFSLYFIATLDCLDHLPSYQILVKDVAGVVKTVFFGILVPSGEPMDFEKILDKYYDGRISNLMSTASRPGFSEPRDTDILDDLGLVYKTYRVDDPDGDTKWFERRDDRWRSFLPTLPFQPLQQYFGEQSSLIQQIVDTIGSRMYGGFHDES